MKTERITPEKIIQLLEAPTEDRRPIKHWLRRNAPANEIINALRISNSSLTKRILCDILGSRHAKSAIPALISCLDDPNWEVRNDAAEALATIGSPKAGEALLRHLIEEPLPAYAGALGAIGYNAAIPQLMKALSSTSSNIRGIAAWSLGELLAYEAKDTLLNALTKETDESAAARIRKAIERIR